MHHHQHPQECKIGPSKKIIRKNENTNHLYKKCMYYTEETPLFQLLNNNELIVLVEQSHSVRKDKSS